jgi:rhodanese-related sulfurtransferase
MPAVNEFKHIRIPLAQLADNSSLIKSGTIIAFCQSGKRSLQAAQILSGIFGTDKKIYSLRGESLSGRNRNKLYERKKTKEHICARANCCIIYC